VLVWFNVFGALGIKSTRFANLAGVVCDNTGLLKSYVTWETMKSSVMTNWGFDIQAYYPVATKYITKIDCEGSTAMWFALMWNYGENVF
jgi:hypothetical protein